MAYAEAEIDRLLGKVTELQDLISDINSRLINLEAWVGRAFFIPVRSRWVLELFPDEIEEWRRAVRTIPTDRLTEKERSFIRNLDYYIVSERKLTLPQLAWLSSIRRKAGGAVPEIPIIAPRTTPVTPHHSSLELPPRGYGLETARAGERRLGKPRTEEERLMRHYGLETFSSPETEYNPVPELSSEEEPEYQCLSCGYKFSTPQEICPLCYGKVVRVK